MIYIAPTTPITRNPLLGQHEPFRLGLSDSDIQRICDTFRLEAPLMALDVNSKRIREMFRGRYYDMCCRAAKTNGAYETTKVCLEWHPDNELGYHNFLTWIAIAWPDTNYQNDKDVLFPYNKNYDIYKNTPLPAPLNSVITDKKSGGRDLPMGTYETTNKDGFTFQLTPKKSLFTDGTARTIISEVYDDLADAFEDFCFNKMCYVTLVCREEVHKGWAYPFMADNVLRKMYALLVDEETNNPGIYVPSDFYERSFEDWEWELDCPQPEHSLPVHAMNLYRR